MNRLTDFPLIVLSILGFAMPIRHAQAQTLSCAVDDGQCLQDAMNVACSPRDSSLDACLTWLRRLEEDSAAGNPEWRLTAASGYFRAARLARAEEDADRFRERSGAILREVLSRWQDGYYANQAYVGLANLSSSADEEISLLYHALHADPDNQNTMLILASHLEQ